MTIIKWDIGVDSPIAPNDVMPELPKLQPGDTLVIGGRAPTWRFGRALHAAHGSAAGVVCFFDPKLGGGVVVASHRPGTTEGEVIPCEW